MGAIITVIHLVRLLLEWLTLLILVTGLVTKSDAVHTILLLPITTNS